MEYTKNEMPEFHKTFFKKLKRYLDTKIYFFGSVQRLDYFPYASDIDVDIFTDNESSTILKLQDFLKIDKNNIKNFIFMTNLTNTVIYGRKLKYEDESNNLSVEICVFNENIKEIVLKEHLIKNSMPIYVSILLIIIKFLYYKLHILPYSTFIYVKRFIMNTFDGIKQTFVVF